MVPHRLPKAAAGSRGFTLVEAVMVIVLIGILAAVGAPMIANGMRVSMQTGTDLGTVSQLRYATERIVRELREVRFSGGAYSISVTTSPLTFTKIDGTAVSISLTGANLTLGYGGSTTLLSNQVSGLNIVYTNVTGSVVQNSPSFVDVQLTLTNPTSGASYTQNARVALRNL